MSPLIPVLAFAAINFILKSNGLSDIEDSPDNTTLQRVTGGDLFSFEDFGLEQLTDELIYVVTDGKLETFEINRKAVVNRSFYQTIEDLHNSNSTIQAIRVKGIPRVDISKLHFKDLIELEIKVVKEVTCTACDDLVFSKLKKFNPWWVTLSTDTLLAFQKFSTMFPNVTEVDAGGTLIPPSILLSMIQIVPLNRLVISFDFDPRHKSWEFGEALKFMFAAGLSKEMQMHFGVEFDYEYSYEDYNESRKPKSEGQSQQFRVRTIEFEGYFDYNHTKIWSVGEEWTRELVSISSVTKSPTAVLVMVIYFTLLYTIITIGILGNVLSLVVLFKTKMKKLSSGVVLFYLTMCDSVVVITYLVNSVISIRIFYNFFVKEEQRLDKFSTDEHIWSSEQNPALAFALYPLNKTAYTASVYLTVLLSLERVIAICLPLKSKSLLTQKNCLRGVLAVLLFSIILNAPRWFESYEWNCCYSENSKSWNEFYKPKLMRMATYRIIYHGWIWTIVMYLFPFLLLGGFNYKLYMQIKTRAQARQALSHVVPAAGTDAEMLGITKILVAVVSVFVLCNAIHICIVFYFFVSEDVIEPSTIEAIAGVPIIVNSSVNFIIYMGLGKRFRQEFVQLLPSWSRKYFHPSQMRQAV